MSPSLCTWTRAPSSFHSSVVSRLCEHRCERLEKSDRVAAQRFSTSGQRASGDRSHAAGDHRGAAHGLGRQIGGGSHGLDHQALERALAQLADQQSREECPLMLGSSREERGEHAPALGDRARAAGARDPLQRAIDFHERQLGLRGMSCGLRVADRGPADSALPLTCRA